MRKTPILGLMFFIMCSCLYSADNTTPYQFLRFNSGSRAAALGGATVSMPEDGSMMFYNPAVISTVEKKSINVTFLKHVLDINSGNVSYITKIKDYGVFSAGVVFTDYGSFDRADKLGNKSGTFGANDFAISFGYSNKLDSNLFYGVSAKMIYVGLEDGNSTALAIDAGLLYRLKDKKTNIGFSILNSGFQLSKFYNYSESVPLDIRLGINHRLEGLPLLINFSFHHLADSEDSFFDRFANFSIGGEIYLGPYIMARVGYDNQIHRLTTPSQEKGMAGFSGGIGLNFDKFNLDYSISQIGLSAYLHRMGVSLDI